jgi:peptidoglycan/LPS O-acetylase OafA/YrhL
VTPPSPAASGAVATRERGYMPQLDALRFFAVLGVMVVHNWQPSPSNWIFGQIDWGDLGVRLFFVLSGFLITGILIGGRELAEAGHMRRVGFVRRFYARRFLRIFPVYYALIAVLALAGVGGIRAILPWLLGYSTNIYIWHTKAFPYAVPHFWTLAVEEQFYVVWPWVLLFLSRRWIVPVLSALCLLGPAWRLFDTLHYPRHDWNTVNTFTPAVIDFLAIGALLAVVLHAGTSGRLVDRFLARVALPLGIVAYAVLFAIQKTVDRHVPLALEDTAAALVFCWLIASASRGFTGAGGRLLTWRPIVYLGKISYGIYLYHLLVPLAFARVAPHLGRTYHDKGFLNFVVTSVVTFAVASLSWHLFERPINGLKRRFRYDTATAPSVVVTA